VLFSTPLLRAINLSIAVLLLGAFVAVWWYAWRPLPAAAGDLAAPVSAAAAVARDELGVPHIRAASWQDALFLQGYVTAQDRMWQMDTMRRLAAGELAEIFGAEMLESDREARRLRLGRIASALEQRMTPQAREILAAYARGVNFYLERERGNLPVEFTLLGYHPRPWRARDTILLGLYQYRALTTRWQEELRKLRMLEKGDPGKVAFLFPPRLEWEAAPGSNAWAVSGRLTASGKPILASDPHLEFSIPSVWYMVHLAAPDLDVAGASLPGIPAVVIGHNRRIAWGFTNLEYDMQDLYREELDPQSGVYTYRGRKEQAVIEREAVAVKGQPRPVEIPTLVTRHGPLFVNDEARNYTLRWVAAGSGGWDFPLLDLNRAANWEEFLAALRRYPGPAQNAVYADVDGNIGYHAAGPVPLRPDGCPGDVPSDGASGQCEWSGMIPFEDLPQSFNPDSGIIVSANQNPFPAGYRYPVSGYFASPDRALRIRELLESRTGWRAEDMLAIQTDVYSRFLHFLARQLLAAWERKPASNQQSREAVEALRGWDGRMEADQAAPMVALLLFEELRKAVARRAAPGGDENYTTRPAVPAIERLLRERPPDWFPDYDALLVEALASAIDAGERLQGSRVSRWKYGQLRRLQVQHPLFGRLPLFGRYFSLGPAPMSGSETTVKQLNGRLGPSFRMVVDFADLDGSLANLLAGQSGHPLSRHYKDQWDAYYRGTSFRMQFDRVNAVDVLNVRPF
jgi:penicillin amidase